ncbi:response regulator transcription factor [Corynebacterium mastitidis]|uniref:DNA-binding response regulator n=1 Tax=Corynebacterium mastitidis TaxID=161890 RepID=A0A2N0X5J0_9CORY|nr:response regulator transcription factor [Corynebacterium mastitidis]MCH6196383.1 response regulator transcription factor [Corynebacterium mastitidis]PKF67972.1 DNA-binding response regulator [Corynebacterium mastitidis]
MTPPIRVLLADDQPLLASALATILSAEGDIAVVAVCHDGEEALRASQEHRVDVAVLDIRMPRVGGIEAARALAPHGVAVLMLTTFNEDSLIREAIGAGASGFLLKDADPAELVRAVRSVHRGQSVLSAGVTGHVLRAYRRAVAGASALPTHQRQGLSLLTARELEILSLIAAGHTNAEIAAALTIGAATVKTHVSHLLAKLHCRDRVALVLLAHRAGLAPPPDGGESPCP